MNKELNEKIIEICLKIAKRNEGALIILGDCKYKELVKQEVPSFNILSNPKLLESLALMDGACIINHNGFLKAYGVMVETNKLTKLLNFGTRHNSGLNVSMIQDNIVYVVSEEDNHLRIFQKGKLILEVDSKQKDIEKKIPEINKVMESVGWGSMASFIGTGLLVQTIGVSAITGITIFVTTFGLTYLPKKFKEWGWIK